MQPTDLRTCKEIAALAGVHYATAIRHAHAGRFGAPVVREGGKHARYSLAAVEKAYGKTFSSDQTEAADKRSRSHSETVIEICRLIVELNNRQWLDMLVKRGITNILPPSHMEKIK